MPRPKKVKDKTQVITNNVLQKLDIGPTLLSTKQVEVKPDAIKVLDANMDTFRVLTLEEKEKIKTNISLLEEHEQLQLVHFIRMDNVKHTVKQNGILLNLKNASDEFVFKIHLYINKCIENKKYRVQV